MLPSFSIYTKPECPWCDKAKERLSALQLPVAEFDVTFEDNKERLKARGLKTVPQIWYNSNVPNLDAEYIGGFEALEAWLEKHKDIANV